MQCTMHPNMDAVGNCVSCGRWVCDHCQIRFNNLVHCKECVESGRVQGNQPPASMQQPYYQQLYPMAPPPGAPMYMPPYTMAQTFYMEPKPQGPPSQGLFKMGAAGALICSGFMMAVIGFLGLLFTSVFGRGILSGMDSYTIPSLVIVTHLPFYILIFGYLGLKRNYGANLAMLGVSGFLAFHSVSLVFWIINLSHTAAPGTINMTSTLFMFIDPPVLGIGLFFLGIPLKNAAQFIPPMHEARRAFDTARILLYLAGIFFIVWIGILFISWILLAIAMFILFNAFRKAPMPDARHATTAPASPYGPAPSMPGPVAPAPAPQQYPGQNGRW